MQKSPWTRVVVVAAVVVVVVVVIVVVVIVAVGITPTKLRISGQKTRYMYAQSVTTTSVVYLHGS